MNNIIPFPGLHKNDYCHKPKISDKIFDDILDKAVFISKTISNPESMLDNILYNINESEKILFKHINDLDEPESHNAIIKEFANYKYFIASLIDYWRAQS